MMVVLRVDILTQALLLTLLCPGVLGEECYLHVDAPRSLEALNGSCVQIPCKFIPPDSSEPKKFFNISNNFFGVWIINDYNFGNNMDDVIFNGSEPKNTFQMNITGDLQTKDCTTLLSNLTPVHSKKYFFRIENRPYLATAACDPITLTVKDSPWTPSLKVNGNQTEDETLTITCSALTPCPHDPPKLTMDPHQGNASFTTNSDGTVNITMEQKIVLTDSHNGQVIKCSAAYPVNGDVQTAKSSTTLNVAYGPKDTSVQVSPSGPLSVGQSVTLRCSSRANPPVQNLTWFRNSTMGPDFVSEGDTYNFNLTENGDFYCEASSIRGKQSSEVVRLRITDPVPPLPWKVILGLGIGLLLVLCLAAFAWFLRSQYQASKETQGELIEQPDKTNEEEETIHYGEIDFSKVSPQVEPDSAREETVYSEVQVSKPEAREPTVDVNELYATVKNKK